MLSNQHYYHRIIRKMVVAFGTMFNNIHLIRYDKAGTSEIERIIVPLAYGEKEKFYSRITQDPQLTKETMITLPRMGFNLDSITYDPLRKTSIYNNNFAPNLSTGGLQSTKVTPYNFNFTLSIYVRNVEDGTQIIEQILPYFNPDYTLSMQLTEIPSLKNEVPIILESINQNNQSEGSPDPTRIITWDLNFTMKGYFYGALSDAKLIRSATANTFFYNTNVGLKEIQLCDGSGNYKTGEMVYEGYGIGSANATAYVESWNSTSNILTVVDTNGILKPERSLIGTVTGASWNICSVSSDQQLYSITVTPDPLNANANDDFGYTTTVIDLTNVSGTNFYGQPQCVTPVNTSPPTIIGTPAVNETLVASVGSWTGTTPLNYSYVWVRTDGQNDTVIDGATSSTYTLTSSDIGYQIFVAVNAINACGAGEGISTSTSTVQGFCIPPSIIASNQPYSYFLTTYNETPEEYNDDYISSTAYDSQGNIYFVGGEGYNGIITFVTKMDSSGNVLWQKTFDLPLNTYKHGDAIVVDNNDDLLVMVTETDYSGYYSSYLIKLSSQNGSILWQTKIESPNPQYSRMEEIQCIAIDVDSQNNVYITGYRIIGLIDSSHPRKFFILLKYDANGANVWQKIGDISNPTVSYYEIDGTPVYNTYNLTEAVGIGIAIDNIDNIYVTGWIDSRDWQEARMLLMKFDVSGNVIWQRRLGSSGNSYNQEGHNITIDTLGNVYIVGQTKHNNNTSPNNVYSSMLIVKYSSAGNLQWQKVLWGEQYSDNYGYGASIDSNNNLYIGGDTWLTSSNSNDAIIAKFDTDGNLQWQRRLGSVDSEYQWYYWGINNLKLYDNRYIIGGYTYHNVYSSAAWLAQLPIDGSYVSSGDWIYAPCNLSIATSEFVSEPSTLNIVSGDLILSAGDLTNQDLTGYGNNIAEFSFEGILGTLTPGSELYLIVGSNTTGTTPITYTYQWYRGTTPVSGATTSTYALTNTDIGNAISVTVTATNACGSDQHTYITSSQVQGTPPVNIILPTILGNGIEGEVMDAGKGTWTGTEPITYTYQWSNSSKYLPDRYDSYSYGSWLNYYGRMHQIGIAGNVYAGVSEWTVNFPVTGSYYIGISGDDVAWLSIDDVVVASTDTMDLYPWTTNTSFSTTVQAGNHSVKIYSVNSGGSGTGFGAVIECIPLGYQVIWSTNTPIVSANTNLSTSNTFTIGAATVGADLNLSVTATNDYGQATATDYPNFVGGYPPVNVYLPYFAIPPTEYTTARITTNSSYVPFTSFDQFTSRYIYSYSQSGRITLPFEIYFYNTNGNLRKYNYWDIYFSAAGYITFGTEYSNANIDYNSGIPHLKFCMSPLVNFTYGSMSTRNLYDGRFVVKLQGKYAPSMGSVWYVEIMFYANKPYFDVHYYSPALYYAYTGETVLAAGDGTNPYTAIITDRQLGSTYRVNLQTPTVGEVLYADIGYWSGTDGANTLEAPATIDYKWYRGTSLINGQTSNTYTVSSSDIDSDLTVDVTVTNKFGTANATSLSMGTAIAAPTAPLNLTAPSISGTIIGTQPYGSVGGGTLTATDGTWSSDTPITYTYEWYANGALIQYADTNSISDQYFESGVFKSRAGQEITVVVTATTGGISTSVTSPIYKSPLNTSHPTINGTVFRQDSQLTVVPGSFDNNTGLTYTYQWYRELYDDPGNLSGPITGATNATYTLTLQDSQEYNGTMTRVNCTVTATNATGSVQTRTYTSNPIHSGTPLMESVYAAVLLAPSPLSGSGLFSVDDWRSPVTPDTYGGGITSTTYEWVVMAMSNDFWATPSDNVNDAWLSIGVSSATCSYWMYNLNTNTQFRPQKLIDLGFTVPANPTDTGTKFALRCKVTCTNSYGSTTILATNAITGYLRKSYPSDVTAPNAPILDGMSHYKPYGNL